MVPLPDEVGEEAGREDHVCLYDEGNVYVTHSAAVRFAAQAGIPTEQARRFLTWFLLDAHLVVPAVGTRLALYRRRLGSAGWDVSARVVEDAEREGLMVVTSVSARPYRRAARRTTYMPGSSDDDVCPSCKRPASQCSCQNGGA